MLPNANTKEHPKAVHNQAVLWCCKLFVTCYPTKSNPNTYSLSAYGDDL